jgi:hypothetical protein
MAVTNIILIITLRTMPGIFEHVAMANQLGKT